MPIKTSLPLSYTHYYVEQRKTKRTFLKQIAQLIDWESVSRTLERYYPTSQSGRRKKAYPVLVLFKMALLQTWYNLSDYGVEKQVNDSPSCMRFCGLQLEYQVPDHNVVGRFRKALKQIRGLGCVVGTNQQSVHWAWGIREARSHRRWFCDAYPSRPLYGLESFKSTF